MSREVQKERVLAGGGDLGALLRSMAWERTALGAVEDWPPALRTLVGSMLGSPQPTCLYWGPDFLMLYNDGYRLLLGDKHPAAVGSPAPYILSEDWEALGPLFQRVLSTGEAEAVEHPGRLSCYTPLRDEYGALVGLRDSASGTTGEGRARPGRREEAESLASRLRESEERLRRVAESSGAGFFDLDLGTGRITADTRAYTLLGLVPGSPLTLDLALACVYAADREGLSREIAAAVSGDQGDQFLVAARVVGLGEVPLRWVESRGQRRLDAQGRPMTLEGALLDITARKEAEAASRALLQALGESEERFRLSTRATKDAIWDWNLVTNGVTWNEGLRELFGYTTGDVGPDSGWWLGHIHPEDREGISQRIHAIIDTPSGGHWHDEYRFARRDGTWAFVADRGWVSRDASGRALRMVGAMQDVTGRKEAEFRQARQTRHHALRAQVGLALSRGTSVRGMLQECAQALVTELEAAFACVWMFNPAHNVLEPCALAGPPGARDGAGEWGPGSPSIADLIVSERAPHVRNEGVEDPRLGDPAWARSEGLVAFAGYPLLVGAKRVGVVAVYSRRELPRDALELLEQVADSLALGIERLRAETELRMRVDFEQQLIGIVSHDLRNPLNAILLGATVLSQREVLDARATKSVLRIQSSAERASRMVKDLLDFTQARLGGGIRIDPRPTDIHEVARGVLEEVEAAHPTRELEVRHEGEGQGVWDADRLAQVVQNLVTNALKYSPEDSTVRILTRAEAEGVSLSVRNQGTPIPPNKLASIFEPLQRATAEVDKTGRSVGLGLYIVRSIVDAHGGTISVTSRETEGTVFTVRLPRHRVGA